MTIFQETRREHLHFDY